MGDAITNLDETAEMASVSGYQTAKGRRYRARWRDASARQRERRGFTSQREAWLFVASLDELRVPGSAEIPAAARVQVGELAELWLENKRVAVKPSSFSPLRIAWRVHVSPTWAHVPIGAIIPSAVETWVRQLADGTAPECRIRRADTTKPRSPNVVIRAVGVLAGVLDMAVRDGRIPTNPARDVTNLPHRSVTSRRSYLTNQEVFRLAVAAPDPMRRTLILTLAYTGIRWGEAVGLTVGDVNFQKRRLGISRTATEVDGAINLGSPKSWAMRRVPFPSFLEVHLRKQTAGRPPRDLLFPGRDGSFLLRPDTAAGRHSWWSAVIDQVGLDHLTPHDLRHTAASLAVSAGAHVKVLQRMLGHKSAAMTLDTYADLFEEDLDSVAERLDQLVSSQVAVTLSD